MWGILGLGLKARLFFVFKHCVIIMGIDKKVSPLPQSLSKKFGNCHRVVSSGERSCQVQSRYLLNI